MIKKLVLILVLFIFVFVFSGCRTVLRMNKYSDSEKYLVGNKEYFGDIKKLDIDWYVGNVKIVVSDRITVTESGEDLSEKQKVRSYFENGTLKVKFWKSGYASDVDTKEKHLTVEIPNGVDILIDCVSSSVSITNIECDNVEIETVSGSVDIGSMKCKNVDISSVSGSINIDKVVSDNIDLESVSGKIESLDVTSKSIDIYTVSGGIEVGLRDFNNLEAESVSGRITTSFLADLGVTISFKTTSGDLIVDNTDLSFKILDKKYVIGDGSRTLDVKTTSGNIYLK